jgi:alkylation response protein AidB-like acyl-CoA dehydrogenase
MVESIGNSIRDTTRKFVRTRLQPLVEDDEQKGVFRREIIQGLGELGLTGIAVPEALGGMGLGYKEFAIALEEIASVNTGYAVSVAVTGLPQQILCAFGNDAQKKRFVPKLASGEWVGGFSLSEAGSGSDAGALKTTAKKSGSHWVLNGTKLWTTQGNVADVIVVMARTGGPGPKGISAFLLEKGTPGFTCGKIEKKIGMNTSPTVELILNDVKIPAENLVGAEGDGFKIAMRALNSGRITIAATACGVMQEALDVAVNHAKVRTQFGKAIAEFQGVGFLLADMKVKLEASRRLVEHAAGLRDAGAPYEEAAAIAKVFATDSAMQVTTDAVQVLGGAGTTREFPVERLMREAKILQIVEGTNQIQRLVISRGLL